MITTEQTLGERIRAWRQEHGYSQPRAAGMLRVSVQALRAYEHGRRSPSRAALAWIDSVLSVRRRFPTPG